MRKAEVIKRINEKLNVLTDKHPQWVIEVLKNIKMPKNKKYKDIRKPIPSSAIMKKLINRLNEREEEFETSKEIFSLALKFWDDEYIGDIVVRCVYILDFYNQRNTAILNKILNLVLEMIEKVPSRIPGDRSLGLAGQLWSLYNRVQGDEKVKVMKAYSIAVCAIPRNQVGEHTTNIITQVASYNLGDLEEMLKFISQYKKENNWWEELEKGIVIRTIQNIHNSPNKFSFLYKRYRGLINDDNIGNILSKVITQVADGVFIKWESQIVEIAVKEGSLREFIISSLKSMVEGPNFKDERRIEALNTLLEVVDKLGNNNLNIQIGEWLLKFAEIPHLQQIAPKYIKKSKELLGRKFKISISSKVGELCKSSLQAVNTKYSTLNIYLDFQNDWNAQALLFFSEMLVNAIQIGDNFVNMAYKLLNRNPKIHREKKLDLKDAIESLIARSPQEKERWEPILKSLKK
ncbi:MAG: hypothetical protein H0Z30_05875 [Candidatus Marinimicrobia bacterium]|nr:hypothetical protein [Candidatus Neomarinimicrobiota bacterium]